MSRDGIMVGRSSSGSLLSLFVFLFGLTLTTNVAYVAIIGNTPVYIAYAVALLFTVYFLFKDDGVIRLSRIDKSVWLFAAVACLSLAPSLVATMLGAAPSDAPRVVLRGLTVLFCGLAIYYVVAHLRGRERWLIAGITFGLIINGLVSILQQVAFNSGTYFTLYNLFPQDSFQISVPWQLWESMPANAGYISAFRPQGLFLETSHLMGFLVCFAPLVVFANRSLPIKVLLIVLTAYCAITSLSPNIAFLLVETIALAIVTSSNRNAGRVSVHRAPSQNGGYAALIVFAAITCLALFLFLNPSVVTNSFTLIEDALAALNPFSSSDAGTTQRFKSMLQGLSIAVHNPLGYGWNTESLMFEFRYHGNSEMGSHSYAIRLLIETGVIGLVAYVGMIWRHSASLFKRTSSLESLSLGMAVLFLLVIQLTNGDPMVPWTWALLALARNARVSVGGAL